MSLPKGYKFQPRRASQRTTIAHCHLIPVIRAHLEGGLPKDDLIETLTERNLSIAQAQQLLNDIGVHFGTGTFQR